MLYQFYNSEESGKTKKFCDVFCEIEYKNKLVDFNIFKIIYNVVY